MWSWIVVEVGHAGVTLGMALWQATWTNPLGFCCPKGLLLQADGTFCDGLLLSSHSNWTVKIHWANLKWCGQWLILYYMRRWWSSVTACSEAHVQNWEGTDTSWICSSHKLFLFSSLFSASVSFQCFKCCFSSPFLPSPPIFFSTLPFSLSFHFIFRYHFPLGFLTPFLFFWENTFYIWSVLRKYHLIVKNCRIQRLHLWLSDSREACGSDLRVTVCVSGGLDYVLGQQIPF